MAQDIRTALNRLLLAMVMRIPAPVANQLIRWRFPGVAQGAAGALCCVARRREQLFVDVQACSIGSIGQKIDMFRRVQPQGQVVLVCEIGYRSSQVAALLIGAGFQNIVNLEGGLRALRLFQRKVGDYAAQRAALPADI
jgi:rhodanese-related sulfurtransferase